MTHMCMCVYVYRIFKSFSVETFVFVTGSLGKCSVLYMIMNAHVVTIYNNYDYSCHLKGNVPRSAQKNGQRSTTKK